MKITRGCLIFIVLLMGVASLLDVAIMAFGDKLAAEAWYLPLRGIENGETRAIDDSLISTHTQIMADRHRLILIVHLLCGLAAGLGLYHIDSSRESTKK